MTRHQDFNNLYEFNELTTNTTTAATTTATTTTPTPTTIHTATTGRGPIEKNETNNGSSTQNSTGRGSVNVIADPIFVDVDDEFMDIVDDETDNDNGANFFDDGNDNCDSEKRDNETISRNGLPIVNRGSGKCPAFTDIIATLDEPNFVRLYCNDKLFSRFGEGAYEQIISKKCTSYRPSYLTAYIIDDLNRLREKDPYVCLNYVLLKEYLAMHGIPLTASNDELI